MKKTKILLITGILICSLSQIGFRYLNIDDSIKALLLGFGIGTIIVGIIQLRKATKA